MFGAQTKCNDILLVSSYPNKKTVMHEIIMKMSEWSSHHKLALNDNKCESEEAHR